MTLARTAMVLAAGYGERMRPLTETMPKPLIPLSGRTLVDHVLDRLHSAGVETAVVNVHYLPEQIERHMADRADRGPKTVISDERDLLLNTGGGATKALTLLGEGPFFIHNSDSVWAEGVTPALPNMLQTWDPEHMDCLLLLAPLSTSLGYHARGDFDLDAHGRVSRRGEKQVVPFAFAGVSLCTASFFEDAPTGPFSLNVLWDRALAKNRLYGVRLDGRWMHVGTPEALVEASASFKQKGA